ncbi:hypothetical protein F4781DRAFT_443212 [Annulohypoxylon bovei var. microspora]|nr:hypothetical protein F4781DRAFT_443212 [Annulohypoxylon bovei var. microspora]
MEEVGRTRSLRPRWKNYPEAIEFILKRTIPEHPIARGKFKLLFPRVAKEVNERFDFGERKADAIGIKYVTEKYGSDPVFGNRKMQVVHPAKSRASTKVNKVRLRAKRAIENGDGSLIICPHCEGNGFLDVREQENEDGDSLQESQGVVSNPRSPISQREYDVIPQDQNSIVVGANPYQGVQPLTGDSGYTMTTSSMARVPNIYHGSSHPGQVLQQTPQYPPQVLGASRMAHDNSAYGNPQGAVESNQVFQNAGVWNSVGDTMGGELQSGQQFSTAVGENWTAPITSSAHPGWQNTGVTNVDMVIQPGYEQIGQRGNIPQTVLYNQIDPALRSGMVDEPISSGGGNVTATAPAPGIEMRLPHGNQEETRSNNDRRNVGPYESSPAQNPAVNTIQPGTAAHQPIAVSNVNYLPSSYSFDNAGFNYGLDSAWLNRPLTNTSNTHGDNQNLAIDESADFLQFLNEYPIN